MTTTAIHPLLVPRRCALIAQARALLGDAVVGPLVDGVKAEMHAAISLHGGMEATVVRRWPLTRAREVEAKAHRAEAIRAEGERRHLLAMVDEAADLAAGWGFFERVDALLAPLLEEHERACAASFPGDLAGIWRWWLTTGEGWNGGGSVWMRPWGWSLRFDSPASKGAVAFRLPEHEQAEMRRQCRDLAAPVVMEGGARLQWGEVMDTTEPELGLMLPVYGRSEDEALRHLWSVLRGTRGVLGVGAQDLVRWAV